MRWNKPTQGDMRIIKRFLLLPKTIKSEARWLEFAYIRQYYHSYNGWMNETWVEKEVSV